MPSHFNHLKIKELTITKSTLVIFQNHLLKKILKYNIVYKKTPYN